MSERNVLKLDIKDLSDFQKELYLSRDPNESIKSRFSCRIDKYAWSTHTKVKMVHTTEDDEVTYISSKKFDTLFKSEMHIRLLPIKVKAKYKGKIQICLPHNFGHNFCCQGELKVDDDHHQTLDSVWMDMYSQFFMKQGSGFREHYNRMIGNIPCLEEWSDGIPNIPLIVPQPFYYSRNTRVGLLTLKSSMNTITHNYKIRNKIIDIVRMRYLSTRDGKEVWQEIPCKLKYLDVPGKAKVFPIPDLWTRHSIMSDEEREWHKFDLETGEPKKHTIYTEDIAMITSNNPTLLGQSDIIALQCKAPCKSLFWVAQNIKSIESNNFSNYTTNLEDLSKGWNPCSSVSLKYGSDGFEKMSSEHFDLSEPWDFFPSAPCEPGYNAYAYGHELTTLNVDTAVVLEPLNACLKIKLGNSDPFENMDNNEESGSEDITADENININKDRYIIHVRALVYKKLEINWIGDKMKYLLHEDATKKKENNIDIKDANL